MITACDIYLRNRMLSVSDLPLPVTSTDIYLIRIFNNDNANYVYWWHLLMILACFPFVYLCFYPHNICCLIWHGQLLFNIIIVCELYVHKCILIAAFVIEPWWPIGRHALILRIVLLIGNTVKTIRIAATVTHLFLQHDPIVGYVLQESAHVRTA